MDGMDFGRFFVNDTLFIPGQVMRFPLFIAMMNVEIRGNPAHACKYFARSVFV